MFKSDTLFMFACFAVLFGLCYGLHAMFKIENDYQADIKAMTLNAAYNSPLKTREGMLERVGFKNVALTDYPLVDRDRFKDDQFETRAIFQVNNQEWVAFTYTLKLHEADELYRVDITLPDFYNKDTQAFCVKGDEQRDKQCFLAIPLS